MGQNDWILPLFTGEGGRPCEELLNHGLRFEDSRDPDSCGARAGLLVLSRIVQLRTKDSS
jgi:hypothetical protein